MKHNLPLEYEIIILNESGYVMERVEKKFNYQGFPLSFFSSDRPEKYTSKTIEMSQQMR